MESSDPNPKPAEPELDLYTIPIYSSWFCWDDIHETERVCLKEFFDLSSISRTPKIYKEYRDFMINKYREDPSRRLTFTEVRKSLVGDVTLLHKVFLFLESWGLINFGANGEGLEEGEEVGLKVRVEDGPPTGVRVVAMPNLMKPISVPGGEREVAADSGFKLPPLASYSDVFGDLGSGKGFVCGSCGEGCDSKYYEYTKGIFIICIKCFKNGNYGENRSRDDFKLNDGIGSGGAVWTESETLLLLESVLKHGDDWELVSQNVQTKTKLDCILKLIELPFGEFLMRSAHDKGNSSGATVNMNSIGQELFASSENQETVKTEDQIHEQTNGSEQNGSQDPPSKRKCTASLSDGSSSLMKQVARISTMVGPHVTAAAAEAAVTALCDESSCPREIFDGEEDYETYGLQSPALFHETDRVDQVDDSEMKERRAQSESQEMFPEKNNIPLTLRIRAAIATALGAAGAHAKVLADHEDREIEHLVAIIIETQMKKLQCKIKNIEDLELIMEKEYAIMEELKEHLIAERLDVLQRAFNGGLSKWRDNTPVKSQSDGVF
ncbi:Myb_DNA-binding domain-containing protein/SWIRM domain-containing protein [Cephalotus follicularis]|uniref:Myb_DNA-binding domain-containing protein/SWIRM domain-containing protein n=1 Tax=Cephalotus follicularis TaxID=3775 RepID=A0A1Q3CMX8_CEPFO|nr:Myb_DNA-binding domain-containing protein/SWIRM domain-containing protein [Cephalotus follicularis]